MDEKKMRHWAIEACKRYSEDLAAEVRRVVIKQPWIEDCETKVVGAYRKPLTDEWQLHFNTWSAQSSEHWQVRYIPKANASEEEHIEEIRRLMHAPRELR